MRCEEEHGIANPDLDAEQVRTVGDLYTLICRQLGPAPIEKPGPETGFDRLPRAVSNLEKGSLECWRCLGYAGGDLYGSTPGEAGRGDVVGEIQDDLGCD